MSVMMGPPARFCNSRSSASSVASASSQCSTRCSSDSFSGSFSGSFAGSMSPRGGVAGSFVPQGGSFVSESPQPRPARHAASTVQRFVSAPARAVLPSPRSMPGSPSPRSPRGAASPRTPPAFSPRSQPIVQAAPVVRGPPAGIGAGDVIFVRGTGAAGIGATGGFFGHVLIALGPLRSLNDQSPEAQGLRAARPHLSSMRLWRLETLESTRKKAGLHQAELFLHIEQETGRVVIVGELASDRELSFCEDEPAEIWQIPANLKSGLTDYLVAEVLHEMMDEQKSWSMATALRSAFRSAAVSADDGPRLLSDLQDCWLRAPICSSVVIAFWQRCLCKLAGASGDAQLQLILQFMPLKADRGLPSDLLAAMQRCGWYFVSEPRLAQDMATEVRACQIHL